MEGVLDFVDRKFGLCNHLLNCLLIIFLIALVNKMLISFCLNALVIEVQNLGFIPPFPFPGLGFQFLLLEAGVR